ncbi:MAG: tRNA (adenine-N1)-methyltransferase [Nocardioides sp.]
MRSSEGGEYLVFGRCWRSTVLDARGAAVIYPKDAAQILALADIFPGARVVAGVGSGALTCWLLRAVGPGGQVRSYERREEFAEVARRNVEQPFGGSHPAWRSRSATWPRSNAGAGEPADRVVLDMLAPGVWTRSGVGAGARRRAVCVYVATTTQLSRWVVETLRAHGGYTEPHAWETFVRDWHLEGLRGPVGTSMSGHTASRDHAEAATGSGRRCANAARHRGRTAPTTPVRVASASPARRGGALWRVRGGHAGPVGAPSPAPKLSPLGGDCLVSRCARG